MSLSVTVVTRDLTYVLLLPSMGTELRLVDSGGQSGISLSFVLLLLLVLPGLIERLGILGKSKYGSLSLGFVSAIIFYCFWSLDFVCNGMGRSILLGDLFVGLSYVGTRS